MSSLSKDFSPKISVVLPVYNGEMYIEKAIESILNQSFTDFELIVLNDGSSDKTRGIIDKYSVDARVQIIHQENIGLIKTLNKGLSIAKGIFIARMDADDICHTNRFEVQFSRLITDDSLSVLGSSIRLIDEDGQFLRQIDYPKIEDIASFIKKGSPVAHPAIMMRLDHVMEVGGYREAFDCAEDYDLWYRLHDAGFKIDNCSEVLLDYRQTLSGISFSKNDKQTVVTRLVQLAHDMRMRKGKDQFDGSKAGDIDDLRRNVREYIETEELAKYELIWFGCYHLKYDALSQFDERFLNCSSELQKQTRSLYFLRRAYVNRINGSSISFFSDVVKSFVLSPNLVFNIFKSRLK